MNAVPAGAGVGLRLHLAAGDLDAMDGLVDNNNINQDNIREEHIRGGGGGGERVVVGPAFVGRSV